MHNAVLGSPITHSKSPKIHLAAYRELSLNWSYERFDLDEDGFRSFISTPHGLTGVSLTMPLKEIAYEFALANGGTVDQNSRILKVSNTLLLSDGSVQAFNTDVFGVQQSIIDAELAAPSTLAILGSGATSRSMLLGLFSSLEHLGSISIFARNRDSAASLIELAKEFEGRFDDIQWLPLEAAADFGGADLTCNTLPASVAQEVEVDVPIQGGRFFDVAYNPWPSRLSLRWQESDRISGLEMLLWQALAQIRIFVNGDAELPLPSEGHVFAAMRAAAEDI